MKKLLAVLAVTLVFGTIGIAPTLAKTPKGVMCQHFSESVFFSTKLLKSRYKLDTRKYKVGSRANIYFAGFGTVKCKVV